jgi:hypothetical protein
MMTLLLSKKIHAGVNQVSGVGGTDLNAMLLQFWQKNAIMFADFMQEK